MIFLLLAALLIPAASAANSDEEGDDAVTFRDFNLNLGDRIDLDKYQMEFIEVQSVRDGLVVMRVSKIGGSLDELRAMLLDSPNNFDGGAENRGITITVTDIFDEQSVRVRIEYQQRLGTARKKVSERPPVIPDRPELKVQKTFDKNEINVGDDIKVTISIENTGTGQAQGIDVQDNPPLPEFTYIAGYPPRMKETLDPGQSDSAFYIMNAVKEGSIRVPSLVVAYTDSKKNPKSNSSDPFNITIRPRSKADLIINVEDTPPLVLDGDGQLNISLYNTGSASATRIEVSGEVSPSDGLEIVGMDRSFFEVLPGEYANFSAGVSGMKPGDYTIRIKVNYNDGVGSVIREAGAKVSVLEREYKYQYLLLIIPVVITLGWVYRRYREYKY